jgi:dihydrofolate reductase
MAPAHPPTAKFPKAKLTFPITGVMACDPKGIMGDQGKLPWDIPEELTFFRKTTSGKICVMGRKTFEGLPEAAIADRRCVVISSSLQPQQVSSSVLVFPTIDAFLQSKPISTEEEVFFIGGAQLALEMLERKLLSRLLLSRIAKEYPGDTRLDLNLLNYFPPPREFLTGNGFTVQEYLIPVPLS